MSGRWYSVFWREKKGRWYVAYKADDGQQRQAVVPPEIAAAPRTRRAAEDWAREFIEKLDRGPEPEPMPAAPPQLFEAIAEDWYALKLKDERLAPSTTSEYRSHLDRWILPEFGKLAAVSVDVPLIREWVRKLRKERAATTVRNRVSTLTTLFSDAIAEKWIPLEHNPATSPAVLDELPEIPRRKVSILKPEEFSRLIFSHVPEERRVRYALAGLAGLCDSEIAGLRLRDVNLAEGVLEITCSWR
ncbi:tyrosine-type recombinase/integrase [Polyangium aurulentum]|uniref:tyrosine-type recombinase/integrase n=1 Tax=Polyangium aurulentum TaxID=2567896 RepID=UPI0010AE37F8|nr:site-specific integrase [Polyangium aurulentum]UQA60419.1 site-specific integrase [Polyangium aurulentum]